VRETGKPIAQVARLGGFARHGRSPIIGTASRCGDSVATAATATIRKCDRQEAAEPDEDVGAAEAREDLG
jgi:hypothetical protein